MKNHIFQQILWKKWVFGVGGCFCFILFRCFAVSFGSSVAIIRVLNLRPFGDKLDGKPKEVYLRNQFLVWMVWKSLFFGRESSPERLPAPIQQSKVALHQPRRPPEFGDLTNYQWSGTPGRTESPPTKGPFLGIGGGG